MKRLSKRVDINITSTTEVEKENSINKLDETI